jgi:hypothetical protein
MDTNTQSRKPANWRTCFPSFAVPSEVTNHPELIDNSWGNDAAPFFNVKGKQWLSIFCDHPEVSEREIEDGARFIVMLNGDQCDTGEEAEFERVRAILGFSGQYHEIYNGDSVTEAIEKLNEALRL